MANSSGINDSDLNLQILRRVDPEVDEVLATAGHVCLYYMHVNSQQWTRKNVEGSLYLLKRRKNPRFQMMVLNKLATENYIETIHGSFDFEVNAPYLMYTHGNSEIHGIWFYEEDDLNRLSTLLNRVKSGLPKTDILPSTSVQESSSEQPGNDKAFWDQQVDVSSGNVPIKADMQPPTELTPHDASGHPATQNLSHLLKQAHLKQQQSLQQAPAQGQQQQPGNMSPPLLPPSFFQSQQAAATATPAGAVTVQTSTVTTAFHNPAVAAAAAPASAIPLKQLTDLRKAAALSPGSSGALPSSFTGPAGAGPDNSMLHKLFAKAAAGSSSSQAGPGPAAAAAMQPSGPPQIVVPPVMPTAAVLASAAQKLTVVQQQPPQAPAPTPSAASAAQAQAAQAGLANGSSANQQPNPLSKLFSQASMPRVPRTSNPNLTIPISSQHPLAMPPVSPRQQQPNIGFQEPKAAARARVRAAFSRLLANDGFVDMVTEEFKAAGLLAD